MYSISAEARAALRQSTQEELMDVATVVATQIDGDNLSGIQPGDESSPVFLAIRDQLHRVKNAIPEIHYIYTMRRAGSSAVFVVDGDYGYAADAATIGQDYPQAEPELFAGFSGPSADNEFTIDAWGTVLSGFSPIHDRAGNVVGLVGVDMDSSDSLASINHLNIIVSLVGIIAVFFTTVGLLIVDHRRSAGEQKIEENERKYRTLFERAGDAIFLVEPDGKNGGKIVEANQAAAEMHGYAAEEFPGRTLDDINVGNPSLGNPDKLREALHAGWMQGERIHRRKDGSTFPVEFSATALVLGKKTFVLVIDRDVTARKNAEESILRTTKKLNMLNAVTFNDIQDTVYSVDGYLEISADSCDGKMKEYHGKIRDLVWRIGKTLDFARNYRDLGTTPPTWQNVEQVFLFAISHIDFSSISRTTKLDGVEIYADFLLERVFQALADNVITKGKTATTVSLTYTETPAGLTIAFEDNGVGIPEKIKESIFERGFGSQKAMELFLVREILGITGITIRETGTAGSGARFEIHVPPGGYRFPPKREE